MPHTLLALLLRYSVVLVSLLGIPHDGMSVLREIVSMERAWHRQAYGHLTWRHVWRHVCVQSVYVNGLSVVLVSSLGIPHDGMSVLRGIVSMARAWHWQAYWHPTWRHVCAESVCVYGLSVVLVSLLCIPHDGMSVLSEIAFGFS